MSVRRGLWTEPTTTGQSTINSARRPENVVIVIPPRRSAVSAGPTDGPWAQRDTALERIRQVGRREWQKESGYRQQARVENSFFRYKSVLGGGEDGRSTALVTRHAVALNPFASVRGRQDARADDSASAGVAWLPGPVNRRGAADLHRGPGGSPGAAAARGSPEPGNAAGLAIPGKGRQAARDSGAPRLDAWIAAYLEAGGIDLSPKAAPLFLAAERGGWG